SPHFYSLRPLATLHPPSFPTRRSSDLAIRRTDRSAWAARAPLFAGQTAAPPCRARRRRRVPDRIRCRLGRLLAVGEWGPRSSRRDRKSTRLNSSHVKISYAVFCLKKKK